MTQIQRNLFAGFTQAALVAHLARRLRVYDNSSTVDPTPTDYRPPLLLEIEKGVMIRQSAASLPWWAEILRDVAMGADLGVDVDALYRCQILTDGLPCFNGVADAGRGACGNCLRGRKPGFYPRSSGSISCCAISK
ncbi:hypothetical protein HER14_06805 [Acidithiobacillus thiooxidans]|uniref:hypothetical protein n=1 Tax=Acidithiobacillus TaxID=119977 RepID=UPI0004E2568C|nr:MULTISPECIES: hypothetical protein [Acidithiobacillus]MBE7567573.1 hypothetical protein [Acidithiobacillus sp. HP-11]MBU2742091.1 hypothetical protein [Acidithiobacillus albertensis]MBU2750659.1 hypothetical protein [Acidithiobacillus thiooxidans]MBU2794602.1 hypothetical protein [Acidithiobacillus thiooxidans]MBU2834932.1 hypothetical protein [Acidithiobacillus thiooxidans]